MEDKQTPQSEQVYRRMQIKTKATIRGEVYLMVPEPQARALAAMLAYDTDSFLEMFYKHMGKAELEKHEAGFRKLVEEVRNQLYPQLRQIDRARKVLEEQDGS